MKNVILSGTLAAVFSMVASNPVQALTISLSPAAQVTSVGAAIDLNVQISGLYSPDPNEVLGAYGIGVIFDSAKFSATGVDFGNLLGGGTGDSFAFFDNTSTAGLVTLNETSFLSDNDLRLLQSDSFTLATLHFTSLSDGDSIFSFQNISLAGQTLAGAALPSELTPTQTTGSQVTSSGSQPIPEPTALLLLSAGLLPVFFQYAKRKQS